MTKDKAQAVVFKALQIARLMDEICALAQSDADVNDLLTAQYPFGGSLDEVSCEVVAWRDAMAEKAGVALTPEATQARAVQAPADPAQEATQRRMFGCTAAAIDEALARCREPRDVAMYAMGTLSNAQELICHDHEGNWVVRTQRDAQTIRQLINVAKYAIDKAVPR